MKHNIYDVPLSFRYEKLAQLCISILVEELKDIEKYIIPMNSLLGPDKNATTVVREVSFPANEDNYYSCEHLNSEQLRIEMAKLAHLIKIDLTKNARIQFIVRKEDESFKRRHAEMNEISISLSLIRHASEIHQGDFPLTDGIPKLFLSVEYIVHGKDWAITI